MAAIWTVNDVQKCILMFVSDKAILVLFEFWKFLLFLKQCSSQFLNECSSMICGLLVASFMTGSVVYG